MMRIFFLLSFLLCLYITNAQNSLPNIKGQSQTTLYGQQACVDVTTSDADGDSVIVWWNKGIPTAIFTNNNHTVLFASSSVCVTPERDKMSDTAPHYFTIFATDGKDTTSKEFSITIPPAPYKVHPVITKLSFNIFKVEVKGDTNEPWHRYKNLTFQSRVFNENNIVEFTSYDSIFTFTAQTYQKFKLRVIYRTGYPQVYESVDTLFPDFSSLINEDFLSEIRVYPNPAISEIFISGMPENSTTIMITDIAGREAEVHEITGTYECKINVNGLKSGFYLIKFLDKSGQKISTSKILVQ